MSPGEFWWFIKAKHPEFFADNPEARKWAHLSKLADDWRPKKDGKKP